ncbi:hypothetical protein TRVL_00940 [Trypanosoma vivax]|nr:hypothetical protein TRVL_00940 [Trypanosoma vivax]
MRAFFESPSTSPFLQCRGSDPQVVGRTIEDTADHNERLLFFVRAVQDIFVEMRCVQRPYLGSVCSKRLQDRAERDFPSEYALFVNRMYRRSWDRFLEAQAGITCYIHEGGDEGSSSRWLMARGSLRCRFPDDDPVSIRDADERLGSLVRDYYLAALEDTCRTILMEVFIAIAQTPLAEAVNERQKRARPYTLGGLSLWETVVAQLWLRARPGGAVRLRDLERPLQQLGFHVRLRCRWTDLVGNNLLVRWIGGCVLRVFLNEVGPEMHPVPGGGDWRTAGDLTVQASETTGELVVALTNTIMWGRRPQCVPKFCRAEDRAT